MKRILLFFLSFFFLSSLAFPAIAQESQGFESSETRGRITTIESYTGGDTPAYELTVETEDGTPFLVRTVDSYPEGYFVTLHEGQRVILQVFSGPDGEPQAVLSDLVRTPSLIWIFLFFTFVTVLVGFFRGLNALLGLVVTIGILFLFVFPRILEGGDPVLTTVLGSIAILAINMHLSHGFQKKTLMAFASTVAGLALAVIFASIFVSVAKLSGLGSEEAMFLYLGSAAISVPTGILLAGIILGAVGVLDDIAIAQSEVVSELVEADPKLSQKELFMRAMRVGRHHIASTVNTLVLAYAGASLPLFLLFLQGGVSAGEFMNIELVAEEIVRTLAGTTALVLTVPIATWFAVLAQGKHVD